MSPLSRSPFDMPAEKAAPVRSAIAWTVVLIYAAIILDMLSFHHPWHDEAHFWLIGRDMSLGSLITKQAAIEGSPILRHLMVMALAKSGLPYISLGVLNAVVAIATVAVIVFLSPFAMWQKVAVSFSLYQVFMYGMVWRLYSLAGVLLLLAAYLFRARFRRPLLYAVCISLLGNTCVQMLGVSLLFFAEFVFTGVRGRRGKTIPRREIIAWCVMAVFSVLAILLLIESPDIANSGFIPDFYGPAYLEVLCAPFVFGIYDEPFFRSPHFNWAVILLCLCAFLLLCWDLRHSWRALALIILTYLGWTYIFTYKNDPSVYHTGLMFYIVLAALWIAREDGSASRRASKRISMQWRIGTCMFFIMEGLTIIGTVQTIALEMRLPFSGGKDAARYLAMVDPGDMIAESTADRAESILAYLPGKKLWHLKEGRLGTYTLHNGDAEYHNVGIVMARVQHDFPNAKPWLLFSFVFPSPQRFGYELVYSSPQAAWGLTKEDFWLYCPIGTPHPPTELGPHVGSGYPYTPFDAKALLRFLD